MKQILINSEELQVRVAVVEDGTLQDFFMERTNKDRIVGSIYKGKIKNLEPSLQAAFVDIGVGKNAFLHYWDMLPATLEKLEGDGEDDDEPPAKNTHEPEHLCAECADEEGEAPAESVEGDDASETKSAEEPTPVLPQPPQGKKEHASLAKGLVPLEKSQPKGLIPLSKPKTEHPEPPKAAEEPAAEAPKTAEEPAAAAAPEAPKAAPEEPAPVVEHIDVDENPRPLPEEQSGRGRDQNSRRPQGPNGNGGNGQRNGNGNQLPRGERNNGDENGEHRRRRRRRGRGGNGGQQQSQNGGAKGARKPGVFRRILEALFPGLKRNRLDGGRVQGQQQPGQGARGVTGKGSDKGGLTANSGKNELLPLTPNGKAPGVKGQQQPQSGAQPQGKLEKLPKPDKEKEQHPKKQEKKGYTVEDIPNLFHVDQEILVQVTKGPIGTKGARVTTNLSIPGRYLVLLPNCPHVGISRRVEDREERSRLKQMVRSILPQNTGVICRTEGVGLKKEHFQRDLQMLMDAWHKAEDTAAKRRAPVCVYQEPALVERTLRDNLTQDIDEIVCDTREAYELAQEMLKRFDRQDSIQVKLYSNPTPIFIKYGISQQIEGISNRKVPLPSGGYLCIDETEALIAIDVNTGKNRSGKDQPETILATNMEAVKEIARQLRLRNIGGLVVLDLIDMRSRKDQMAVYRAFKQYTAEDHARIKIYPISGLGLLEMSRQRESESLESTIYEDCPYCRGRGLIKTATSVSVEIQRRLNELLARKKDVQHFVITVHPKILERLRTVDHKVMNAMAAEYNRQLTFNASPELHIEAFHIADKDTGKVF